MLFNEYNFNNNSGHTMDTNKSFFDMNNSIVIETPLPGDGIVQNVTISEMVVFSTMFFIVGTIGITGNIMVIYIVFSDSKMRLSMTNMLIVNLAWADLAVLLFGIPEIVMFMINKGWLLGLEMCKIQRAVLVTALYASVMTLLALCVERYIAIVFPIKAHLFCTRRRTLFIIILVWMLAIVFGMPTLLFNTLTVFNGTDDGIEFCVLHFPHDHQRMFLIFKYTESFLFYFMPLLVQIVCYVIIGQHLFIGIKELHGQNVRQSPGNPHSVRCSDTILARRGVIKMLIVSVVLYFLSYLPHQILLIFNTFSPSPFHQTWAFLVAVTVLAYINSAGNPIIYCVFSEKYRRKFKAIFSCGSLEYTADGDTICLHSSVHATEYTQFFRKSTKRPASMQR